MTEESRRRLRSGRYGSIREQRRVRGDRMSIRSAHASARTPSSDAREERAEPKTQRNRNMSQTTTLPFMRARARRPRPALHLQRSVDARIARVVVAATVVMRCRRADRGGSRLTQFVASSQNQFKAAARAFESFVPFLTSSHSHRIDAMVESARPSSESFAWIALAIRAWSRLMVCSRFATRQHDEWQPMPGPASVTFTRDVAMTSVAPFSAQALLRSLER